MKLLISLFLLTIVNLIAAELNVVNQEITQENSKLASNGVAVDEVVVESSLFIKPKQQRPLLRRVRRSILGKFNIFKSLVEHKRVKRQVEMQNYNRINGLGNSAANAPAHPFNAHGATGGCGASTADSLTQALNGNHYGEQNSASDSHALTFNFPNGRSVNFASTNSFKNGLDGNTANGRGSAVSVNRI